MELEAVIASEMALRKRDVGVMQIITDRRIILKVVSMPKVGIINGETAEAIIT